MRHTKIVGTVGPASLAPDVLRELLRAGLDVARVNCSHIRDPADLAAPIRLLRRLADEEGQPLAILLDLGGPKVRTGELVGGAMALRGGAELRIRPGSDPGRDDWITCNHAGLAKDVAPGARILMDDGLLELRVTRVLPDGEVVAEVVVGGTLLPRKGMNLPDNNVSIPALTAKDRRDLSAGLALGVDYVALSFVQRVADVEDLRAAMAACGVHRPIVAKIEKPQAVEALDDLLDVVDGVMVARGDLAVEVGNHRVPVIQKEILARSGARGTLDIVATQMLESMTQNPRPTRAEASDVANAVLDGCDAVMLSAEMATGRWPVESVRTMDRILRDVEPWMRETSHLHIQSGRVPRGHNDVLPVVEAAARMARSDRFAAIVCYTVSGQTARLVSGFYPRVPIFAKTPDPGVVNAMALYRGVVPIHLAFADTSDEMLARGEALLLARGLVAPGAEVVVVAGSTPLRGATNMVKIVRL